MSQTNLARRVLEIAPEYWLGDFVYHVTGEGRGIILAARFDGAWQYMIAWSASVETWHYGRELSTEETFQSN